MPLLVANERGRGQTESCSATGRKCGAIAVLGRLVRSALESVALEGDSPVALAY